MRDIFVLFSFMHCSAHLAFTCSGVLCGYWWSRLHDMWIKYFMVYIRISSPIIGSRWYVLYHFKKKKKKRKNNEQSVEAVTKYIIYCDTFTRDRSTNAYEIKFISFQISISNARISSINRSFHAQILAVEQQASHEDIQNVFVTSYFIVNFKHAVKYSHRTPNCHVIYMWIVDAGRRTSAASTSPI